MQPTLEQRFWSTLEYQFLNRILKHFQANLSKECTWLCCKIERIVALCILICIWYHKWEYICTYFMTDMMKKRLMANAKLILKHHSLTAKMPKTTTLNFSLLTEKDMKFSKNKNPFSAMMKTRLSLCKMSVICCEIKDLWLM